MIERWVEDRSRPSPLTEQDLLDLHAQVLAEIDPRSPIRRSVSRQPRAD
jgi:hypothetical protein